MDFNYYILSFSVFLNAHYFKIKLLFITSVIVLGLLGLSPLRVKQDEESTILRMSAFFRKLAISLFFLAVCIFFFINYCFEYYGYQGKIPQYSFWIFSSLVYLLCKIFSIFNYRVVIPYLANIKERFRVSQTSDNNSDIRVEIQNKSSTIEFDPTIYYNLENDKVFEGLNQKSKPVYSTIEDWRMNNKVCIGPTQIGKGVDIGVQVDQSIKMGDITIYIDPKPDKFLRSIMIESCKHANRELLEIDLTGEWDSRDYALLKNGSVREKKTRLLRLLNLENTGTDADHYKTKDRTELDKILSKKNDSFNFVKDEIEELYEFSEGKLVSGTYDNISEIISIPSVNDKGLDIEKELFNQNKVLYVRCSTTDSGVIRLATALIEDVIQTIFRTSPHKGGNRENHVFLVVDELRFMLTGYIADSLATLKSDNAHMLVAFQSFNDSKNIKDRSIDKESLQDSIFTNCTYKLIYRADTKNQAEWASEQTGTINKKVTDRVSVKINKFGGESQDGGRSLINLEENLITENKFMMLSKREGVLTRPAELAQIIRTCWISVDPNLYIPKVRKIKEKPINIREENKRKNKKLNFNELLETTELLEKELDKKQYTEDLDTNDNIKNEIDLIRKAQKNKG